MKHLVKGTAFGVLWAVNCYMLVVGLGVAVAVG